MTQKNPVDQEVKLTTKPSKARINSKSKGNGFELKVSKLLSDVLSPLKFIRSPQSGARLGGKNFAAFSAMFGADATQLFVGDVVPTNEKDTHLRFKYSLECKSYKTSDSFETMVAGNANIFKWMQESVIDAVKVNKKPLIVFKWNHTPLYTACLSGDIPLDPKITLTQNGVSLDIFYFADLLENSSFWCEVGV
jgi:hypothetical protein